MSAPVVEITNFPFMEAHCARPRDCPVCQSRRCQFGRLGDLLDPPQPQCVSRATLGNRWCDEHTFPKR